MCEKRICEVEHGSFTPIVLSSSGGWGPSATVAFKGLASLLSMKLNHHYIRTLTFLRSKVTFSLLDSAIIVSGEPCRYSSHRPAHDDTGMQDQPLDLIVSEAGLFD